MSRDSSNVDGPAEIEATSSNTALPSAVFSSSQSSEYTVILPMSMNDDGSFVEESVDLSTLLLTKPGGLQDICRRYKNISSTGNKAQLVDRLRDLSANKERWREQFVPGAHRKHKGSATSRKSQLKRSNVRREALFGPPATSSSASSLSMPRSRSAAESAELAAFGASILAQIEHESQQGALPRQVSPDIPSEVQPQSDRPAAAAPALAPTFTLENTQLPLLAALLTRPVADALAPQLAGLLHSMQSQHIVAQPQALFAVQQQSTSHPATGPSPAVPGLVSQSQNAAPSSDASRRRRTVHILDQELTFQYNQLPDPPALPVEDDIVGLAAHWGDNAADWHAVKHATYLRVCDTPIPILYWKQIYIGWKGLNDRRWELLKARWIQWRFLVKEFRAAGSNTAFWERYTVDGKRLPITRVLKAIKSARVQRDKRIAEFARDYCAEHGESFDELFQYRKGGKMFVHTRDHVIARRWQELGRPMPPDVSVSSDEGDDGD